MIILPHCLARSHSPLNIAYPSCEGVQDNKRDIRSFQGLVGAVKPAFSNQTAAHWSCNYSDCWQTHSRVGSILAPHMQEYSVLELPHSDCCVASLSYELSDSESGGGRYSLDNWEVKPS